MLKYNKNDYDEGRERVKGDLAINFLKKALEKNDIKVDSFIHLGNYYSLDRVTHGSENYNMGYWFCQWHRIKSLILAGEIWKSTAAALNNQNGTA